MISLVVQIQDNNEPISDDVIVVYLQSLSLPENINFSLQEMVHHFIKAALHLYLYTKIKPLSVVFPFMTLDGSIGDIWNQAKRQLHLKWPDFQKLP